MSDPVKDHPAYPLMEYLASLPEPVLDRELSLLFPEPVNAPRPPIFYVLLVDHKQNRALVGTERGTVEWHTEDARDASGAEYRQARLSHSEYARIPIREPVGIALEDAVPEPQSVRLKDYTIRLREYLAETGDHLWICRDVSTGDWWIKGQSPLVRQEKVGEDTMTCGKRIITAS